MGAGSVGPPTPAYPGVAVNKQQQQQQLCEHTHTHHTHNEAGVALSCEKNIQLLLFFRRSPCANPHNQLGELQFFESYDIIVVRYAHVSFK